MSMVRHLDDVDAVAAPQAEDSSLFEHVGEGVVHAQRFPAAVNLKIQPKSNNKNNKQKGQLGLKKNLLMEKDKPRKALHPQWNF